MYEKLGTETAGVCLSPLAVPTAPHGSGEVGQSLGFPKSEDRAVGNPR